MLEFGTLLLSDELNRFAKKSGQMYDIGHIRIAVFDHYEGPVSEIGSKAIDLSQGSWEQSSVFINSVESYSDGDQYWVAHQVHDIRAKVSKKEAMSWVSESGSEPEYDDPLTVSVLTKHNQLQQDLALWSKNATSKARSLSISLTQLLLLKEVAESGARIVQIDGIWLGGLAPLAKSVTRKRLEDLVQKQLLTFEDGAFKMCDTLAQDVQAYFFEHPVPLLFLWRKYGI